MSKKLMVWALAVGLGLGSVTTSLFAEDAKKNEMKKEEPAQMAEAKPKKQRTCRVKKKKKMAPKVEEIPTEPSPDAKTPERK